MENSTSWQDEFFNCFELIVADKSTQAEAFRLRHLVYCEELEWEPARPSGLETDSFDNNAFHILIQHKRTRHFAGTVRVVLPNKKGQLPYQKYFGDHINADFQATHNASFMHACEISRLTVSPFFKRRKGEAKEPFNLSKFNPNLEFNASESRNISKLTICLYMASIAMATRLDVTSLYMASRPGLNKIINGVGIHFSPVSGFVELHGKRKLHHALNDEDLVNVTHGMDKLYDDIQHSIDLQLPWSTIRQAV